MELSKYPLMSKLKLGAMHSSLHADSATYAIGYGLLNQSSQVALVSRTHLAHL